VASMAGVLGTVRKTVIRPVWMQWERGFGLMSRWRSAYAQKFGICTVMVRKYHGAPIACEDSTCIRAGDWIGELHLDNVKVLELLRARGTDRAALMVARQAGEAMVQISRAMAFHPQLSRVKALIGVTLLHRGLTHGLGFEQHEVHSRVFRFLTKLYLRMLLSVMHPDGGKRIGKRREQLVPVMLVHTRESLRAKFGDAKAPGPDEAGPVADPIVPPTPPT